MDHERRLRIISAAWGRQKGHCFFPWIDGSAPTREQRIASYHEGPAFEWPADKTAIIEHMEKHWSDDLYWCPSLFEYPHRRLEFAMDEHCLWADLDEVDPRGITDYPPTVAWETSPGRYQALWLIAPGYDVQGASWQGGENQRLTQHLGADPGGWDTTQLLRLPEWPNHKPGYADERGEPPMGRLLWGRQEGRRYMPDEFGELPEIEGNMPLQSVVVEAIKSVSRREAWARVRLRVSREVRELMAAREADGDRSERLWQMERDLADAGCTPAEIVALVRPTVWNKYRGRQDEIHRLVVEASKAVQARPPSASKRLEAERGDMPTPIRLALALRGVRPPKWLVREIWTEGGCGFIAGQPKSFKSWMAFDLALSVATGSPFLGDARFRVDRPGKVLYVQEEDSLPTLKSRYEKLWGGKRHDRVEVDGEGEVHWLPPADMGEPEMDVLVREGMTLSDPSWQGWLDEQLTAGEYRLLVLDPLLMMTGDVDEFRGAEVTSKIFRPLSELSNKHDVAIALVHHMRKRNGDMTSGFARGGQMMLGSAAYHAWAHDALYLTLDGAGVEVQRENKDAPLARFKVTAIAKSKLWQPKVSGLQDIFGDEGAAKGSNSHGNGNGNGDGSDGALAGIRRGYGRRSRVLDAFEAMGNGPHSVQGIKRWVRDNSVAPISSAGVYAQLNRMKERDHVTRTSRGWLLTP